MNKEKKDITFTNWICDNCQYDINKDRNCKTCCCNYRRLNLLKEDK